jgi:hypothetical protein
MIEFLTANWVWIVLVVALFVMHRGGGCGGHASHNHKAHEDPKGSTSAERDDHPRRR